MSRVLDTLKGVVGLPTGRPSAKSVTELRRQSGTRALLGATLGAFGAGLNACSTSGTAVANENFHNSTAADRLSKDGRFDVVVGGALTQAHETDEKTRKYESSALKADAMIHVSNKPVDGSVFLGLTGYDRRATGSDPNNTSRSGGGIFLAGETLRGFSNRVALKVRLELTADNKIDGLGNRVGAGFEVLGELKLRTTERTALVLSGGFNGVSSPQEGGKLDDATGRVSVGGEVFSEENGGIFRKLGAGIFVERSDKKAPTGGSNPSRQTESQAVGAQVKFGFKHFDVGCEVSLGGLRGISTEGQNRERIAGQERDVAINLHFPF